MCTIKYHDITVSYSNSITIGKNIMKMNAGKTKFMNYNQPSSININTNDGTNLEEVHDFKYLCAWMASTAVDIQKGH